MNDKRLAQIAKRIERIKEELRALGPMRPGSLTQQYKDPHNRSGPHYQLSYTRDMKSKTDYIAQDTSNTWNLPRAGIRPRTDCSLAVPLAWPSAFLLPASLVIDRPWTLDPSPAALLAVLALGFLCTGVALLIYFRLVRTLGSLGVASQSYLRAGVSVLLGVGLLGEQLTAGIGVGLVAVVAGVVIINTQAPAVLLRVLRGKR